MTGATARMTAYVFVAMLVLGAAGVVVGTRGGGGPEVKAEFEDVKPLLAGNHVRVHGVVVGSVDKLELTDHGTVLATMRLRDDVPRPRRDAVATVRAEDFLGENYISLSPGHDPQPLRGVIPTSRTARAPVLNDVLSTLRRPVRVGLQALLVELGRAFERRGDDLNRALVELRPALTATQSLLDALGGQRAGLRRLLASAQRATEQIAARHEDVEGQLVALDRLLTTTAARAPQLDRALETLPPTLARARGTLIRTRRLATEARPLSRALLRLAPDLGRTARQLGPFSSRATGAIDDLRPTLRLLRRFLRASTPTVPQLTAGARGFRAAAPALGDFMRSSGPGIVRSLTENFYKSRASVTVEPGNQPGQKEDPLRFYFRGIAVYSCETVGKPRRQGCLADFLRQNGVTPPSAPASRRLPGKPASPAAKVLPGVRPDLGAVTGSRPGSARPVTPRPSPPARAPAALLDYLLGR